MWAEMDRDIKGKCEETEKNFVHSRRFEAATGIRKWKRGITSDKMFREYSY